MTQEDLIRTASALRAVTAQGFEEYRAKRNKLVARINERMLARPDILFLVGADNLDMMKDNHSNHARFVESILLHPEPEVLVDTVLWVFRAYRSRGFHPTYWAAQINAWIDILGEELSADTFAVVYPLYEWFSINIPHFTHLTDIQLSAPSGETAP